MAAHRSTARSTTIRLRVSSIGEDAVEDGRKFKVLRIAPPDDDGEENAVRLWLDGDAPLALEPGKYRWGIAKDDVCFV